MSLSSIQDLIEAPGLSPKSDAGRISRIRRNRRLLNNDFSEFETDYAVAWPRRLSNFYGEFLFQEIPEIQISNNPRMEVWANETLEQLTPQLVEANKNLISFGQGVLASHPRDPTLFESFPPDSWFTICDLTGDVSEDALVRIRGEITAEQVIDLYKYDKDGNSTWTIYRYGGSKLGEKLADVDIVDRAATRQVAIMDISEGSLFDVIRPQLKDLSKILGKAGVAVSRNLNPHLSGPAGALDESEDGEKVDLSSDGEYLPREDDDPPFEYVSWDANHPLAKYAIEENEKNLLIMSALSPLLFSPNQSGNLSGRSLGKLVTPFVARCGRLARENTRTIKEALRIANENRRIMGLEYFSYQSNDLEIEWKYNEIFEDNVLVKMDREPVEAV